MNDYPYDGELNNGVKFVLPGKMKGIYTITYVGRAIAYGESNTGGKCDLVRNIHSKRWTACRGMHTLGYIRRVR